MNIKREILMITIKPTNEQTWLDCMPFIPLARGVPVVVLVKPCEECGTESRTVGPAVVTSVSEAVSTMCYINPVYGDSGTYGLEVGPISVTRLRADLGDPQGFGYTLRWLANCGRGMVVRLDGQRLSVDNFVIGLVSALFTWHACTNADRLALARVVVEVAATDA